MKLREEANSIYDEKGRELAKIDFCHNQRRIQRTSACTVGEYFSILTWLLDRDEQTAAQ